MDIEQNMMITGSSIEYYVIEWGCDVLLDWMSSTVIQCDGLMWSDMGGKGTHARDALITSALKLSTSYPQFFELSTFLYNTRYFITQ